MPELAPEPGVPANAAGLPTITPHEHGFGAEIGNIDLTQPLSDAAFELIHEAFLRHKVLVFRGQPLDDEAHQSFAMKFGDLEGHINVSTRHAKLPQVQVFSNAAIVSAPVVIHAHFFQTFWAKTATLAEFVLLTAVILIGALLVFIVLDLVLVLVLIVAVIFTVITRRPR